MRGVNKYDNAKNRKSEVLIAIAILICSVITMYFIWVNKINMSSNIYSSKLISRSFELMELLTGNQVLNLFISQLSLTFITISVMSVLSEKTVTLFWLNLIEDNLISPAFRCFYAYVIFSFTTMAINLFAIFFNNYGVFIIYFIINLIVLFLLTYSMLTVYFRQDRKEQKAIRDFQKEERNGNIIERRKKMKRLKEYTLKAHSNNDIDTLNKNLSFYSKYCKVEDVVYFLKEIDGYNIELLGEVLLRGYDNQIKQRVANSKYKVVNSENIRNIDLDSLNILTEALDDYNIINMIPKKSLDDMMSKDKRNEFHQFYEQLLINARSMMILYFNFISEKSIIMDNMKTYKEFRQIIREGIRGLKNEGVAGNEYRKRIYEYEKKEFYCLNDEILNSFFSIPSERYYAFHEGLRKLPIMIILEILKGAIEDRNFYFITVFIATFQQFPIFKYMHKLDTYYSNNVVYKNIQTLSKEIKEKASIENEEFLNLDWLELFRDIFGR